MNKSNRERLVAEYDSTGELLVDLGSDQTSCHNPFNGGYYPVQLSFEEANQVMTTDTVRFKNLVQERFVLIIMSDTKPVKYEKKTQQTKQTNKKPFSWCHILSLVIDPYPPMQVSSSYWTPSVLHRSQ